MQLYNSAISAIADIESFVFWTVSRAQTNIQLFREYSNTQIFKYNFGYSNVCFKGNIHMIGVSYN